MRKKEKPDLFTITLVHKRHFATMPMHVLPLLTVIITSIIPTSCGRILLLLWRLLSLLMWVVRLVSLPQSRRGRRLRTTQTSIRLIGMLLRWVL